MPADMVFLSTTEKNGACFIRSDQLDGETDWKLRLAVSTTQRLSSAEVKTKIFLFLPFEMVINISNLNINNI